MEHNSYQSSQIDESLELLLRRGLLGLKDVPQAFRMLFEQTDGYVDGSCSLDRGISWGWHSRPIDAGVERSNTLRCLPMVDGDKRHMWLGDVVSGFVPVTRPNSGSRPIMPVFRPVSRHIGCCVFEFVSPELVTPCQTLRQITFPCPGRISVDDCGLADRPRP